MCQAYEGERNFIIAGERRASRNGYRAALDGKPRIVPRHFDLGYDREAWLHGYDCKAAGITPASWDSRFDKMSASELEWQL